VPAPHRSKGEDQTRQPSSNIAAATVPVHGRRGCRLAVPSHRRLGKGRRSGAQRRDIASVSQATARVWCGAREQERRKEAWVRNWWGSVRWSSGGVPQP
jgi:hypothetical protein